MVESTTHTLVVGPLPLRLLFVTDPGLDLSQNLAWLPGGFCDRFGATSIAKHVIKNFCDRFGVDLSQNMISRTFATDFDIMFCDRFGVDLSQNMSSRTFATDLGWIKRVQELLRRIWGGSVAKTCYPDLLRRIWGGSVTNGVKNFCDGFGVDPSQHICYGELL